MLLDTEGHAAEKEQAPDPSRRIARFLMWVALLFWMLGTIAGLGLFWRSLDSSPDYAMLGVAALAFASATVLQLIAATILLGDLGNPI